MVLRSSHKRYIWVAYVCGLLFAGIAVAAPPKARTHLPASSVAVSDDALATFFNPAGLGVSRALNLYYLRTYQSESQIGDDAFFIAAPGAGFGMEFATAENDTDFTRYSLSTGRHFGSSLYWGTSYSWINSDDRGYDTFRSLSLGLMYRRRYFSIGAITRNLNRPRLLDEKLGRAYDIGIALRPGTWRATFSLDMQKTQGISGVDFQYALELRPIREVMLRGTLNSDRSFDIRFGINIGNWGVGTDNRFADDSAQSGVGYFQFSSAPKTKSLPRRRKFIDVSMGSLERTLRIAKRDKDVAGVLIRINGSGYGMGQLQEMRDAILDFKESGRVVISYLSSCSTGDYIVASACDAILMHPSAEVRLIGLRAERSFYKGALELLGIRADIEHIGKYKSAAETFTRREMSEAHREVQNVILDELYEQLVTAIAANRGTNRGWTSETVKNLIDGGPYTAKGALNAELVDRLVYEDELPGIVTDSGTELVTLREYAASGLYVHDWRVPRPKIAIIEAAGLMMTGDSFIEPLIGTRVMGSDTIARAIRYVREDASIKAVVLRIDSGGGLVVAADILWRELVLLAEVKPLVVSMADVAASGGYYIAAPADVIVAEPGTITGSIGVIGGKYSFKGLYENFGIRKEILKRGKHADFYTDYGDYPPAEQAIVHRQISEIYDDFITKVAIGRTGLTKEDVDNLGRGRIWTGAQAKERGLVDELGGLSRALEIAKEKAGLLEKGVEIVRLPKQTWFSQLVSNYRMLSTPRTLVDSGMLRAYREIMRHRLFLLMPLQIALGD